MKRSVVIQKQYLFKHPGPEDGPAQGLFPQLRGRASVDRRKDAHAAAEGLSDPGEVGGACDLVHGQPLRVHPAQQHLHACGLRAGVAERADVRHHVVAQPVLILGGTVKIDIVEMRAHFLKLLVRDGQPQLLLALGEREPETAERRKLPLRGEEMLHLLRGIARAEGIFINVFHETHSTVTDLARLRGLSMSHPLHRAT